MKLLITGGTGFLGSYLVKHFVKRGFEVSVLARQSSSVKRLEDCVEYYNLLRYSEVEDIAALVGDNDFDCVIHTACSYGRTGESLENILFSNLVFGLAVLDAAATSGIKNFVNTGTTLSKYLNSYSLSKIQFSEWGKWLANNRKVRFVDVLLEHMYGPGDDRTKFSTYIIRSCIENVSELNLTAGDQKRDFIYIDDVVSAYDIIVNNICSMEYYDQIQVGTGYAGTIRDFVEKVHNLCDSSTILRFGTVPYREGEMMMCRADTTKLKIMGWKPQYGLSEGIQQTIKIEQLK